MNKDDKQALNDMWNDIHGLTASQLAEHSSSHVWDTTFSPDAEANSLYAKAINDALNIVETHFRKYLA